MFYYCIENNIVTSIMPYLPVVPNSIEVVEVTDEEYASITADTHKFDIAEKKVVPHNLTYLNNKAKTLDKENNNLLQRQFLNDTDWKILRHIRQKALNLPTSLTEQEYIALENQRHLAAVRISN